jgi:diaminopimelate epimerase
MRLKTDLISGAGNTFHISFGTSSCFLNSENAHQKMQAAARQICAHDKADGFIILESSSEVSVQKEESFKWFFFNNDGSDAEMCGNATRCVGYFLKNRLLSERIEWCLQTIAGPIKIKYLNKINYQIEMSPIQKFSSSLGFFCNTGVPHLVLESKDSDLLSNLNNELRQKSKTLRFHPEFSPRGTNVTYVFFEKENSKVKAISFERGVEDFTAACGTGAMAAAFFNLTKRGIRQTQVEMPGGTLIMNLQDLNRPQMTGPAILLGSFENEISV